MVIRRLLLPLLTACCLALLPAAALAGTTTPSHHHAVKPRGGKVVPAWPAKGTTAASKPKSALAQWLAKQVGSVKTPTCTKDETVHVFGKTTHKRVKVNCQVGASVRTDMASETAADTSGGSSSVPFSNTGVVSGLLSLVRSYAIPTNDPSATRLANLSWTYDSAITAIAFTEMGASTEAAQLLSQLSALQNTDGSIDFAYNTSTGQALAEFRAGTIAWVGLAAVDYHLKTCSTTYDSLAYGAAKYLLTLQQSDGLLNGGPDVTWQSTEHNLVTDSFFRSLAKLINRQTISAPSTVKSLIAGNETYSPCTGQTSAFAGMTAAASQTFATTLNTAVTNINTGINANLFVRLTAATGTGLGANAGTAYFREGTNDDIRPVDAEALGILWLLSQGRLTDAQAVLNYTNATMEKTTWAISLSNVPATFNETWSSPLQYIGYTPYDTTEDPGSPSVMWEEGTLQMGYATQMLAASESTDSYTALEASQIAYVALTGDSNGPLEATGVVTGSLLNEYHVWPSSAAAAWALLNVSHFGLLDE